MTATIIKWDNGEVTVTKSQLVTPTLLGQAGKVAMELPARLLAGQIAQEIYVTIDACAAREATGMKPEKAWKEWKAICGGSALIAGQVKRLAVNVRSSPGYLMKQWESRDVKRRREPSLSGLIKLLPGEGKGKDESAVSMADVVYYLFSAMTDKQKDSLPAAIREKAETITAKVQKDIDS